MQKKTYSQIWDIGFVLTALLSLFTIVISYFFSFFPFISHTPTTSAITFVRPLLTGTILGLETLLLPLQVMTLLIFRKNHKLFTIGIIMISIITVYYLAVGYKKYTRNYL